MKARSHDLPNKNRKKNRKGPARILITAPASGCGKTLVTCGVLQALKNRGKDVAAFKCGPDYIDPMFHQKVIGIPSFNLDSFLAGEDGVREILAGYGADHAFAVIEGVMGYYDGLGGISTKASAYDIADLTETSAVLVVDGKKASVSVAALVKGFLEYRDHRQDHSHIQGVVFNRLSPMLYDRMKRMVEEETGVQVYGYVPVMEDLHLDSRHLGLKRPDEVERIEDHLQELAGILEKTVDIDGLLALGEGAERDLFLDRTKARGVHFRVRFDETGSVHPDMGLRIGIAIDEAFCFCYADNLELLRESGAETVFFSPLCDRHLPGGLDGLIFYGGYPELYARRLGENKELRQEIKTLLKQGIPCMAECGGFQYLQEYLESEDGTACPMVGFLPGGSFRKGKLTRFGYIELQDGTVFGKKIQKISAHEFHYYDSEQCGDAFLARKPLSGRQWRCMVSTDRIFAGYPHIQYRGNREVVEAFLGACNRYHMEIAF